ncbi:hypothetical protein GCM10010424_44080 [Streptomyces lienomycini]
MPTVVPSAWAVTKVPGPVAGMAMVEGDAEAETFTDGDPEGLGEGEGGAEEAAPDGVAASASVTSATWSSVTAERPSRQYATAAPAVSSTAPSATRAGSARAGPLRRARLRPRPRDPRPAPSGLVLRVLRRAVDRPTTCVLSSGVYLQDPSGQMYENVTGHRVGLLTALFDRFAQPFAAPKGPRTTRLGRTCARARPDSGRAPTRRGEKGRQPTAVRSQR